MSRPRHAGARARVAAAFVVALAVAFVGAHTLTAQSNEEPARHFRGLALPDALSLLQAQGMRIIYSSDLVRPDMRVQQEPTAIWLHDVVAQLLKPFGLAVSVGPGGSLLVVRAGPAPVMVRLVTPHPGEAIAGEVPVAAEVTASDPVDSLDVFVNGWPAARLHAPPWEVSVTVPDQSGPCRITAVARTTTGGRGSDSVEARRVVLEDRMEVALRQVYVSVSGRSPLAGPALRPEDFSILDGGVSRPAASLARGDTPISAVLLVDASESMRGRLGAAFAAARTFLAGLGPGDEAAVMVFADRLLALTPFGPPDPALLASVERPSAAGGTALNDHLYAALRLLDERPGRRVVLLLSDGADVTSALSAQDVLWKVRHSDAAIYWLRLPGPQGVAGYSSAWRDVAGNAREEGGLLAAIDESGGRSEPLGGVDELARAFSGVVGELRQQVVLGFYPQSLKRDGSWRPLEVRTAIPGLRLRYRAGWVDR